VVGLVGIGGFISRGESVSLPSSEIRTTAYDTGIHRITRLPVFGAGVAVIFNRFIASKPFSLLVFAVKMTAARRIGLGPTIAEYCDSTLAFLALLRFCSRNRDELGERADLGERARKCLVQVVGMDMGLR